MAEFLTTNGTSYHIENIILEAKKKLVQVSPYLQISKTFYERLKDASNRDVAIKIIYGKDELKPNEKKQLAELENLEVFYFKNLHAKCYFNESKMVITSMNMYEFSEKNNREMGVLIDRTLDKGLFDKAVVETHSIIKSAVIIAIKKPEQKVSIDKNKSTKLVQRNKKEDSGHCIRCDVPIKFNPSMPYCNNCFSIWEKFNNPDYEESFCHKCGNSVDSSMNYPQCYRCYNIYQKSINKSPW